MKEPSEDLSLLPGINIFFITRRLKMKINENKLHNRLVDLNEQRESVEKSKFYLFMGFFTIVILLLNCGYIGGAVAALLVPVYVTGHLYLNNKLKTILWKMMYVSNHGFKINPEKFCSANELKLVFCLPKKYRDQQRILTNLRVRAR